MDLEISGKVFDVGIATLNRSFELAEKYRITMEDQKIRRELAGIYKNYELAIGNVDADEYDRLINQLTLNEETQTVKLPDGKNGFISFEAMFENISDELITDLNGVRHWDNLTVTFSAQEPMR